MSQFRIWSRWKKASFLCRISLFRSWCLTCFVNVHHASVTCALRRHICSFDMISLGVMYPSLPVKPHSSKMLIHNLEIIVPHKPILRQRAHVGPEASEDHHNQLLVTYYCSRRPHCSAARCYLRQTDLCHSFLILCSIGSPYFLFCQFLVAWCIRVRFLRLSFLTFQKNECSASYDPLSY